MVRSKKGKEITSRGERALSPYDRSRGPGKIPDTSFTEKRNESSGKGEDVINSWGDGQGD